MRRTLLICLFLCIHSLSYAAELPSYDKRLSTLSYPFPVNIFSFESQRQKLEMAYMYLPPDKEMPVITLLHGKNFNGAYWQRTAEFLHQQGYGVLIPDQVGFGKSSKPVNYQYSFAALAANTRALMSALEIDHSIITGHSMGGMLASRFALLYPDETSQLVLINPIGLENYLLYERYTDTGKVMENELNKTPDTIVSYQKKHYYDGKWNDEFASHAAFLQGWINGPDWPQLAQVSALTYDMIFTQPVIEEFDHFSMPVSMILGTRDRTAPGAANIRPGVERQLGRYDKLGDEVKARNGNINVIGLSGLGHLPHIEDFDRFTTAFSAALHQKTSP